jgi:hypothetical protein
MTRIKAKNIKYDPTACKDYYLTCALLHEKMGEDVKGFPINIQYCQSYIVNVSLFCELSLKMLLIKNAIDFEYTHDLVHLFLSLPASTQTDIAFKTISKINPTPAYMNVFQQLLTAEKDIFEKFRYLDYSSGYTTCVPFLRILSGILYSYLV